MELLTPAFGLIFWTLISFLLAFFILKKFAWPAIINGLKEREKTITESLEMAEKVKLEMAQLKSENEALMAQAREERAQMLREAKDTKDRIINEAKDQAKTEANKIIVDANQAIENQKMAALTEIKNQIGNMVVEVAEKVIRKELGNKADQEVYIRKLSDDLTSKN
ncbi:MAG: F0F1 ATP synthase subunit B [Chitinophagaceae bacterium]